ncbi:DUF4062 domain-containing protein [Vibrio alginolyticus]|uniref:DUF4062 domain-containing protein n=1 Tax=Vibrio TaxID=662 RepID=UPI0019683F2B|nr:MULTISPECIES: DUF4062 domain-containing protein [Vibrio]EHA1206515.1 DUF4062 domain-containing protein [Vibrio alginolyticus]ELA6773653.1 DUF4062 domain-containing protein [Vibrio alginolyticus]MBN3002016.1 DUF4062 domain-containing protein [Vibrio alginolyticus]MBT0101412.1 DUF4062 domain-containing protein [Vibrio alginolyticus]MCK8113802.1 DUF4062 domain-containing protein [Vibrio sp. 2CM40D]
MDKRYQVFVSSTYIDLKDERQSVLQTLMEMDCIPAGMELFPAADEEQWEFIKKVIDDCDYYLLIIGGRYGSTADDGLSYTEKEFDYAVSKGIKVIALLHESPDSLPRSKSEMSEELAEKLELFREKVSEGRLVRYWKESAQLPGEVALSLNKTIKMFPAVGWVRADSSASPELLAEINMLRKRNEDLAFQLEEQKPQQSLMPVDELADWDSEIELAGSYQVYARSMHDRTQNHTWSKVVTWRQLFSTLSPFLADNAFDDDVNRFVAEQFSGTDRNNFHITSLQIDSQILYTIRIQFLALGLISINNDNPQAQWSLTEYGLQTMIKERVVGKSA